VARDTNGPESVVDFFLYTRDFGADIAFVRVFESRHDTSVASETSLNVTVGQTIAEKTDLVMAYLSDNANLKLRVRLQITEEENA
jgi:hypothetical protein